MSNPTALENGRIRVLLVDHYEPFLRAATEFLQRHHELAVVGALHKGEEAVAQAQDLRPQVILVDLDMPALSGLKTISCLRVLLPQVGIIALTLLAANACRRATLAAGADDSVCKANLSIDLLPAIRRVVRPYGRMCAIAQDDL